MKKIVLLLLGLCVLLLLMSAGCTSTTTNFDTSGHKSISATDDLQLTDSNLERGLVVGHVKNNAAKTFRSVKININLYDETGAQVGSTMDIVSNLEPGAVWTFKAFTSVGPGRVTAYKVKEISGS